jgi:trans-aconitate methyltransferase
VSSHYELPPSEYERRRAGHFHRRRVAVVEDAVQRFVPSGGTVVEIGCGPGAILADVAARRPDASFLGLDVEPEMVAHAQRTHPGPGLSFAVANVGRDRLPVRCDLVFAVDVLHHVHDRAAFLRGVVPQLEPAGRLLAIEPNRLHPYVFAKQERMRRAGLDEDHFRADEWEDAFRDAGLAVEERRYLHAYPAWIRSAPQLLAALEPVLERLPPVAGSVVLVVGRP